MARRPKVTPEEAHAAIKDQPLVGVNAASAILGVANSNFKRYRHRLKEVPIEGSSDVFLKADVRELKKVLDAEARAAERERERERKAAGRKAAERRRS